MMDIPADDRGFALGDGLFETVLARAGRLADWDAHLDRLERGCATLGLPVPDRAECEAAARAALAAVGLAGERAAVRLTWSAGSGGRGLDRPDPVRPRLVATAAPSIPPEGPARLATVSVRRNDASPASRVKSLAYLDNVLARREARAAGADEALMLNTRGEIACAGAANLFWIRGRTLMTPDLACGVLDGIARAALMGRAAETGWTVREVRAGPEALDDADGLILTNSLIGARPVAELDGRALDPSRGVEALAGLLEP